MAEANLTIGADRSLIAHGAVMTLLGLASGFTPLVARAPTAALEAHTIGVLQAAMLFGLAAIWPTLGPSRGIVRAARWCVLIGFYANWVGSQLAAFWSTRGMFIVTGASMPPGAAHWMEVVVAVVLNLSVLIAVACVLILWALRSAPKRNPEMA